MVINFARLVGLFETVIVYCTILAILTGIYSTAQATAFLLGLNFGLCFVPLSHFLFLSAVRLRTDRLSLIKECISQCPTAYRQSTLLLSLARLLRVAGKNRMKTSHSISLTVHLCMFVAEKRLIRSILSYKDSSTLSETACHSSYDKNYPHLFLALLQLGLSLSRQAM